MEKMLKVKRSKELQQEIESCRMKVIELENSIQPLVSEALELSTAVDSQFKILKEYDAFAQEKASEASSSVLQDLVEKEKAADDIMHSLNTQFTVLSKKLHTPEDQQSVLGGDTMVSLRGLLGHAPWQSLSVVTPWFL